MDKPYNLQLASSLSGSEQETIKALLALLPSDIVTDDTAVSAKAQSDARKLSNEQTQLKALVDGRGLACPMPLLKTKVALRQVDKDEALYVVATDPNSQADIVAFCAQTQHNNINVSLSLLVNEVTAKPSTISDNQQATDTIFHFIITKTSSN